MARGGMNQMKAPRTKSEKQRSATFFAARSSATLK
jgi:hypothetical protein